MRAKLSRSSILAKRVTVLPCASASIEGSETGLAPARVPPRRPGPGHCLADTSEDFRLEARTRRLACVPIRDTGRERTLGLTWLRHRGLSPIAQRFEIWNAAGDALCFQAGYCSSGADLAATFAGKTIDKGEGSLGQAWATGLPVIWSRALTA